MALNKRKVLDAARKHAQKGAKAKALKEYEKLLKADPRDAKLLLEVGDAYRRWGQAEDAIAQYSKVAAQYRQDGFDARAVAVFKQILNLDPKQYGAFVSLSELYQRMGLDSEAAAALQMAADGYHKEGRKTEALELLRQMGALDPTNTTSRTKVAELLRQEGLTDDALAEYEAIAAELGNQQDRDQLIVIQERILEIAPNHVQTLSGLARTLMGSGELDRAEPYAARAAAAAPEPPQFELLMDLYAQMGNDEGLSNATRALAKLYRDRGDEDKARELMQRLSTDEVMPAEGGRLTVDLSEVEEPQLGDDELLEDEPFLTLDDDDNGFSASASRPSLDFEEVALDTPAPPAAEAKPAAQTAPPAAAPEGDPDQLLAEASVYLRYGKREQALTSLETVLALDPKHLGAHEKLGEWHIEGDDAGEAVKVWLSAVEIARATGDAEALDRLKEKIAAVDPEMATSISSGEGDDSVPSISGVGADLSDAVDAGPDLDLDTDLDLDDAIDAVAESETETGVPAGSPESTSTTFEIELDDDSIVFDERPQTDVDMAEHTQPGLEIAPDPSSPDGLEASDEDNSIDFEIDVEMDGFDDDTEEDSEDAAAPPAVPEAEEAAPAPAMDAAQIGEELEEAEFYVAQDMFDEAEAILARVLEASPGHAEALVMSGEIAAARGVVDEDLAAEASATTAETAEDETDANSAALFDAETVPDPSPSAPPSDEIEFEMDLGDEDDSDGETDLEAAMLEAASAVTDSGSASEAGAAEADAAADEEVAFELDLDLDDGDDGLSDDLVTESPADLETHAAAELDLGTTDDATDESEAPIETQAPAATEPATEPQIETETEAESGAAEFESFDDLTAETGDTEVAAAAEEPTPNEGGESFDLREALADVLEDDSEAAAPGEGVLSTVEDGFGSIFSDFKKGVTETLDEGDYDTRYDLGIAYREMGLFDDAIAEFRMCLGSAERKFDSLYLMGLCARDLERWDDAINHLEQALSLPDLQEERMAGVYFDLSVAHEGAGDLPRAASIVRRVLELEPDFPGAQERLDRLESGATSMPDLGKPGEVYESFDDLFDADGDDEDGDTGMAEAAPAETFESFEDVVDMTDEIEAGDEAEPIAETEPLAEVELAEEPPSTSESSPTQGGSKKSGRRKISFV